LATSCPWMTKVGSAKLAVPSSSVVAACCAKAALESASAIKAHEVNDLLFMHDAKRVCYMDSIVN